VADPFAPQEQPEMTDLGQVGRVPGYPDYIPNWLAKLMSSRLPMPEFLKGITPEQMKKLQEALSFQFPDYTIPELPTAPQWVKDYEKKMKENPIKRPTLWEEFGPRKNVSKGPPMEFSFADIARAAIPGYGIDPNSEEANKLRSIVRKQAYDIGMSIGPSAIAYHGSPHNFDKFQMEKVGTGEGAQAYGHGLYFAENPATAKTYATDRGYVGRAMAGASSGEWDAARIAQDTINVHGDDAVTHLSNVLKQREAFNSGPAQIAENAKVQSAIAMIRDGKVSRTSNLYKVDIPDEAIGKMLDWDKPLSQQHETVQNALRPLVKDALLKGGTPPSQVDYFTNQKIGADIRELLRSGVGDKEFASRLSKLGVPGIKYLDQGSRAAGKGTYNYVVFDENLPKILGKE
jgi:hypothetical protein